MLMITTSLDVLYLVLASGIGMLLISLTVLVFRVVGTVNRINRITDIVEESADAVNTYIQMPASMLASIVSMMKHWKD